MSTKGQPSPLVKSRLKPRSPKAAIAAKCWDCEGCGADPGWKQRIGTCHIQECGIWPFRPYQSKVGSTGRPQPEWLKKYHER